MDNRMEKPEHKKDCKKTKTFYDLSCPACNYENDCDYENDMIEFE